MKRFWPVLLLALIFLGGLLRPGVSTTSAPLAVPSILTGDPGFLDAECPEASTRQNRPAPPVEPGQAPSLQQESSPGIDDPPVDPHYWRRSTRLRAQVWLARTQNEDGSWGDGPATMGGQTMGRAGITAMALLSFLGDGYSHLSKDQHDDQDFGQVILRALKWLQQDQQEDGTFRSVQGGGLDQPLASFALLEAYGMTAAQPLKEPAQRALDALILSQKADGSWGGEGSTAWGMWSLRSAEINEQPFSQEAKARAIQFSQVSPDPGVAESRMKWSRKRTIEDQQQLLTLGPPQFLEFDRLHYGTIAAFRFDGPDGPVWKQWNDGMLASILTTQGVDGSWGGVSRSQSVVRSSLALQTLQVYYVYR